MWSAETVFVCALALLGRSEQSFVTVEFIENAPPGVSRNAAAYAKYDDGRIVLITSTTPFTRARQARDRCGDVDAIREIAGFLAHEEWHLLHGRDEEAAYHAQLTALASVGAGQNTVIYHRVVRSMNAVLDASRRASKAAVVARGGDSP